MTTLPMQYFGRGSARIMMPRAVTRGVRREWVVSPSFMILIISLAFFTLHKLTFNEPLKLKRPRTIIILPQVPAIPKPTVKEKLSFFKVVKDAAQKSAEPRKKELKRVLETPKPLLKKPVPPPAAPPVKPERLNMQAPKTKMLTPLGPKRVETLAVKKEPLPQRVHPLPTQSKPPTPMQKLSTPLPTTQLRPNVRARQEKKPVSLATAPAPMPQAIVQAKSPTANITPMAIPSKQLTPVQTVIGPGVKEQRPAKGPTPTPMVPKKSFSPLSLSSSAPTLAMNSPTEKRRVTLVANTPRKGGPVPSLPQLSAPSSVTSSPPTQRTHSVSPVVRGRHDKPALEAAPSTLPSPPLSGQEESTGVDIDTLVHIQGSTLGQSLRVQNLKKEIYRKTSHMAATDSPYTYQIHSYRCTVVISGGHLPKTTLTFEPSDAPFEVVSALERLLPRRTMQP